MKNLKHLLYPVSKVPSSELLPDFEFTPQQEYAIVVETPSGKKIVNHCSEQYTLVPNSEIVEPLLDTFQEFEIDVTGWNKLDARFAIDIIFKDKHKSVAKKKDIIVPKLRVKNSYDGRLKYSMEMGIYRFVCSNGMVVPLENTEQTNLKLRHTPSLGEALDKNLVLDMVDSYMKKFKDITGIYKELAAHTVSLEERVEEVIENVKFGKRLKEEILDRIEREQSMLGIKEPNDWLVYNGFNYQLNHHDMKMDIHKRERIDTKLIRFLTKN